MEDVKKANSSPLEERRLTRRHLLYYLPITDMAGESLLGRLGDVNEKGLLLLAERELSGGAVYAASIQIPERLNLGRTSVEVGIQVRWCRKEQGREIYAAGCSIERIGEGDLNFLKNLIIRIGFSDGSRKIFLRNDRNVFMEPET